MSNNLVTAMMFHAIVDANAAEGPWDSHYAVDKNTFGQYLRQMADWGFHCSSLRAALTSPRQNKVVVLTFDDGGESDYTNAWPLLAEFGFSADFFVSSECVGMKGYANWGQLRDMHASGMSIQSHGATHKLLDRISLSEIEHELLDSKRRIEDSLGTAVAYFAPPGGRLPRQAVDIAWACGYQKICSSRAARAELDQSFVVPRFAALSRMSHTTLSALSRGDRAAVAPATIRHAFTSALKRVLSGPAYEKLRTSLLKSTQA